MRDIKCQNTHIRTISKPKQLINGNKRIVIVIGNVINGASSREALPSGSCQILLWILTLCYF